MKKNNLVFIRFGFTISRFCDAKLYHKPKFYKKYSLPRPLCTTCSLVGPCYPHYISSHHEHKVNTKANEQIKIKRCKKFKL